MPTNLTREDLAVFFRKWASELEAAVPPPPPPPPSTPKTGILLPLYIYPGPAWDRVEAQKRAHPSVPITAIFNPGDGPGTAKSATYAAAIPKLVSAGCIMVGYVLTDYMRQPIATVKADIKKYKDWYPEIHGVFLDEVISQATTQAVTYYTEAKNYAESLGFTEVIGNPGTTPEPGMFQTADALVVHETSSAPTLEKLRQIEAAGGKGKMDVLIHSVSKSVMESWVPTVKGIVRLLYVTEDVLNNPWDTVASYFERTVEILDS